MMQLETTQTSTFATSSIAYKVGKMAFAYSDHNPKQHTQNVD